MVWLIYMGLGIKRQGLRGYMKTLTVPVWLSRRGSCRC